jgi:signal transduction histidine kinase
VLEQFSHPLADAKCHLELHLDSKVVGVWDRARIEQIIVNLISNAIKYAPEKLVKVEVSVKGETAKLVVQDFGPGIPREQQAKIFERFERAGASRNIAGLGLGLFIVKQVVEAHHGTISVDSQEGEGSTFTVELPIRPSDVALQGGDQSWKVSRSPLFRTGT